MLAMSVLPVKTTGVASCPSHITVSTEGACQPVSGTAGFSLLETEPSSTETSRSFRSEISNEDSDESSRWQARTKPQHDCPLNGHGA